LKRIARNKSRALVISFDPILTTEQIPDKVSWLSPKERHFIKQVDRDHVNKLRRELNETIKNISGKPTTQQLAQIEYSLAVLGKKESANQVMNSPPLSKSLILAVLTSGRFHLETRMQKEFSEQIPNAIFMKFPNSSHYIQNDQPQAVMNVIEQVVSRVCSKKINFG
jgi:hypothetical protein